MDGILFLNDNIFLAWEFKAMIMRLRELIIAFKNKGKRLSYGREIKYHRSRAKYPVLDRNMVSVSGGFAPHMLALAGHHLCGGGCLF